nr:MAG TPA: hypothetical protein [Inoviridae sp.]
MRKLPANTIKISPRKFHIFCNQTTKNMSHRRPKIFTKITIF